MEAGAYARMWNTAVARKIAPNPFIEATGESLKLRLPKGARSEIELEWKVPDAWNAFERNRARAYCIPYTALVAMVNWLTALDLMTCISSFATTFQSKIDWLLINCLST